jgi:hypothetical protein
MASPAAHLGLSGQLLGLAVSGDLDRAALGLLRDRDRDGRPSSAQVLRLRDRPQAADGPVPTDAGTVEGDGGA